MVRVEHDMFLIQRLDSSLRDHRKLQKRWLGGRAARIDARASESVIDAGNVLIAHADAISARVGGSRPPVEAWVRACEELFSSHPHDLYLSLTLEAARHSADPPLNAVAVEELITEASRKFRDVLRATARRSASDAQKGAFRRTPRRMKKRMRKDAVRALAATFAGSELAVSAILSQQDPNLDTAATGSLALH